jgi:hypothetical protein
MMALSNAGSPLGMEFRFLVPLIDKGACASR